MRSSKVITDAALIEKVANISSEDITRTFMYELFGDFDNRPLINPYDFITIPKGTKFFNKELKENFTCTIGQWIFNKWFINTQEVFDELGFITNEDAITGKVYKQLDQKLSYAVMEDRVSTDSLKKFLIVTQLIMPFVVILSPNQTEKLLTCTKAINKRKAELYKKYKKELDAGDPKVIEMVEKELLDFAVDYIGDDPSMDQFKSDARSNLSNHFKNMYVMKGAVRNPDPNAAQEYNCAFSNYSDGISAEEYALYCDAASFGAFSRGNKTGTGGYLENLFAMAFQHITLDEKGTDCKTTRYRYVSITSKNVNRYIYNNIIGSNGQLIELNSQNMDKYIGKTVKMRFADLCTHAKPCNACSGNMFYKFGIVHVGPLLMQIPSSFKNKAMKAFHDSTVKTNEMDVMKAFGFK